MAPAGELATVLGTDESAIGTGLPGIEVTGAGKIEGAIGALDGSLGV